MSYYRGMTTQVVSITGHKGDKGEAYFAKPEGDGPFGAVVLIHHMPGWDDWIMEAARKFAHQGLMCIAPNLYFREPGSPDDQAAKARADGGVSDDQVVGDVEGALAYVRARKDSNGKVGVMGFCSGGRHAFICAARIPTMNAIVDCWGGSVIVEDPAQLTPKRPVNPIDYAKDIQCPILGIFGNDDKNPDPAQVDKTEAVLKSLGKTFSFHRYDGAGHGFFGSERPAYRVEQALDGWKKTYAFFHQHLG